MHTVKSRFFHSLYPVFLFVLCLILSLSLAGCGEQEPEPEYPILINQKMITLSGQSAEDILKDIYNDGKGWFQWAEETEDGIWMLPYNDRFESWETLFEGYLVYLKEIFHRNGNLKYDIIYNHDMSEVAIITDQLVNEKELRYTIQRTQYLVGMCHLFMDPTQYHWKAPVTIYNLDTQNRVATIWSGQEAVCTPEQWDASYPSTEYPFTYNLEKIADILKMKEENVRKVLLTLRGGLTSLAFRGNTGVLVVNSEKIEELDEFLTEREAACQQKLQNLNKNYALLFEEKGKQVSVYYSSNADAIAAQSIIQEAMILALLHQTMTDIQNAEWDTTLSIYNMDKPNENNEATLYRILHVPHDNFTLPADSKWN